MRRMIMPTRPGLSTLLVRRLPVARHLRARLLCGLLTLGGTALTGCGGHLEFDLGQAILEQRVTGNAAGGTLTMLFPSPVAFGLKVDQEAKARNAQGPITTVSLTGMQFQVTDTATPPGGSSSFDFVSSATVNIESTRANSSLPKAPVANLTAPGRTIFAVPSTIPSVNLLPYITEGAHFTASATGTLPSHDITFIGSFVVHVKTL